MTSNPWDGEIESLGDEIAALKNITRRMTRPDKTPLVSMKAAVLQSGINVSAAVDRLIAWAKRGYQLGPKEHTLVHWASVYAQRLHRLNEDRNRFWTRMLWVRLIQARIGDRNAAAGRKGAVSRSGFAMDTDELVGLAVRYTTLAETEQQLDDALVALRERQSDLLSRYHRLGIADANRNASGSLQARLGIDFDDAMQSAPARALSGFVDQLSVPVHHDHGDDEWLAKVKTEFSANTQSVLEQCRGMVLSMFSGPVAADADKGNRSLKHLKDAIKKLEDLEQRGVEAERQAHRTPPPVAKPKVVQNRRIQARK